MSKLQQFADRAKTSPGFYTAEVLEGIEDISRNWASVNWNVKTMHRAAVSAGLATEHHNWEAAWNADTNQKRFELTALGTIVLDQILRDRKAAFIASPDYQKRLNKARAEFGVNGKRLGDCDNCGATEMVTDKKCLYCGEPTLCQP